MDGGGGPDRFGDVEFMIEDMNNGQTRLLSRRVITTFGIVHSAGVLSPRVDGENGVGGPDQYSSSGTAGAARSGDGPPRSGEPSPFKGGNGVF